MTKRIFFIIIFGIANFNICMAIDDCTQVLSDAKANFEAGHLYSIPAILKDCIDQGFSRSDRIQAYILLTRTYLIIDDPISAEDSYLKLLSLDPEYKVDEDNDPISLVMLSKKFTATPIFELTYAKVGSNLSTISVIHNYTMSSDGSTKSYTPNAGVEFGPSIALNINKNFNINADLLFISRNFTTNSTLLKEDPQTLTENQFWVEVPFYLKYIMKLKKFHPYAFAGISLQYLFSSKGDGSLTNIEQTTGESKAELPVKSAGINMLNSRNQFTQSFVAGVGVRYRIGYYYVFAELKYTGGLNNILDKNNHYSQQDNTYNGNLAFKLAHAHDAFRINSESLSIGFVRPLYKPRKIVKKKTWLKSLFNKKELKKNENIR